MIILLPQNKSLNVFQSLQDYWQQQQKGKRGIENHNSPASNVIGKRHSMNHQMGKMSVNPYPKPQNHLSLSSLGPALSNYSPGLSSLAPSSFHNLPGSQHAAGHPTTPTNYYFGCHPSHVPQSNYSEIGGDRSSLPYLQSNPGCYTPQQYIDSRRMSNEELDKSEDLIYESIYDSRWRLLNQVRSI